MDPNAAKAVQGVSYLAPIPGL